MRVGELDRRLKCRTQRDSTWPIAAWWSYGIEVYAVSPCASWPARSCACSYAVPGRGRRAPHRSGSYCGELLEQDRQRPRCVLAPAIQPYSRARHTTVAYQQLAGTPWLEDRAALIVGVAKRHQQIAAMLDRLLHFSPRPARAGQVWLNHAPGAIPVHGGYDQCV